MGASEPAMPREDRLAAAIQATRHWVQLERGCDAWPGVAAALHDILQVSGGLLLFRPEGTEDRPPKMWGAFGSLERLAGQEWEAPHSRWSQWGVPLERWVDPPSAWSWAAGAAAAGIWPFSSQGDFGALLLCRSTPRHRWPDDSATLRGFAAYLGLVLSLIRQRHMAESLSSQDPLTGLLNRRGLQQAWQERVASARRHRHALVLAVADVDHLKDINDREGHLAGDRVLRRAADQLRHLLRGDDAVGRWGGDEFVGILTVEMPHVEAVARRVREGLMAAGVAASVGAAVLGVDGATWAECFDAADRRCYAMKTWR